ncbi:MAG: DUF3179 domain-containing protein [Deltaproteobacteria bacterium]|nr:DUF3179 domain-containing protein [Deltaproteobacteria bacterium]
MRAGPNGFDLTRHAVPPSQILSGGPPRDGIPALLHARFVPASQSQLQPDDRVLGIAIGGRAKAYPLRILNWHEVVNDEIGGLPVVITYCPLCASGVAFDRRVDGQTLVFGVSGLLYNSNVLLYDRQSESLWTQIGMRAVAGPRTGARLRSLPLYHGTWSAWRARHPGTLVQSFDTGFIRSYDRDPYVDYPATQRLMFPVEPRSNRLPAKTLILGVEQAGEARAYPLGDLRGTAGPVRDRLGGREVRIVYDLEAGTATVLDEKGREIQSLVTYWFAWYAFHPDTGLWQGTASSR